MKPQLERRKILITLAAFFVVILASFALMSTRQPNIDRIGEEGEDIDYSTQARIVANESFLQTLGGVDQKNFLASDLHAFARSAYSEYRDSPDKVVGFEPGSVKKTDNKLSFNGRFGSVKNNIKVEVEL